MPTVEDFRTGYKLSGVPGNVEGRMTSLAAGADRLDTWEAALLRALLKVLDTRFAHRMVELLPRAGPMARPFPTLWAADSKNARIGIVLRHPETLDDAGIERDATLLGQVNEILGGPQSFLFMIEGTQDAALESKLVAKVGERLGKEAGLYVLAAFHEFGVPPPPPPRLPCEAAVRFVDRMKTAAVDTFDFSTASLEAVDRVLVESALDDAGVDDAGMYVGEVMLRAHGGRWEETEMGHGVQFPDESMAFPTAWTKKFVKTRAEPDRLTAKYDAFRRTLS